MYEAWEQSILSFCPTEDIPILLNVQKSCDDTLEKCSDVLKERISFVHDIIVDTIFPKIEVILSHMKDVLGEKAEDFRDFLQENLQNSSEEILFEKIGSLQGAGMNKRGEI